MAEKKNEGCTACSKETSAVWRRSRETKEKICNKCYITKYGPAKASAAALKAAKVEVAVKEELKEELKAEAAVKTEVKTEVKSEVKSELPIKREKEDEAGGSKSKRQKKEPTAADAAAAAAAQAKREADVEGMFEEEAAETDEIPDVHADTDTEYVDCDVEAAPFILHVENTSNHKLDGKYRRMPKSSRGRPCYFMRKKGKIRYLYWCNKKWMIGEEFGAKKSFANVPEKEGLNDCCEPYPHAWKVMQQGIGSFAVVQQLRVYSAEAAAEQQTLPMPPREIPARGSTSPTEGAGAEPSSAKKPKKPKKPKKEEEAAGGAAASQEGKSPDGKETSESKAGEAKVKVEDKAAQAAAAKAQKLKELNEAKEKAKQLEDFDEAKRLKAVIEALEKAPLEKPEESSDEAASSDDDDSSSDSESSSSDSGAPSSPAATPKAPAGAPSQAQNQKVITFNLRMRKNLAGIKDKTKREEMMKTVRDMFKKDPNKFLQSAGLTEEKVGNFLSLLEHDYITNYPNDPPLPNAEASPGTPDVAAAKAKASAKAAQTAIASEASVGKAKGKPRPPGAPPPKHLLEKRQGPEGGGSPAQPSTPPDPPAGATVEHMPHRSARVGRSILKPSRPPGTVKVKDPDAPHISLRDRAPERTEMEILSYRGSDRSEDLWYVAPGSQVICDQCETSVPQTMGSLQGAPAQSQFAQFMFLCSDCMQRQATT